VHFTTESSTSRYSELEWKYISLIIHINTLRHSIKTERKKRKNRNQKEIKDLENLLKIALRDKTQMIEANPELEFSCH